MSNRTNATNPLNQPPQPLAQVTQLPGGQLSFKWPNADPTWLLGWLEVVKASVLNMMRTRKSEEPGIAVPDANLQRELLANGTKESH